MVIKPFKIAPKVPDNFGMETWDKLKTALDAVYAKSTSFLSKEELYRVCICCSRCVTLSHLTNIYFVFPQAVEDLCVQKMGAKTYELLIAELEKNITKKVLALDQQVANIFML